ncbi:MAG: serine/threonine-protein kinase [Cyanobacteria bacterium P01_A01_bin.123]
MPDNNIGRKLANRYELIETVGQGSMGRVYLAEDGLLGGVQVAVKFLSQTLLNEKMRERFVQEATTCAQLGQKSIHVVRVTDYGVSEDEIPYYVMEYLRGNSLSKLINLNPLAVPRFLGLARQISLGLVAAHEGIILRGKTFPIIHRDIKPSNILVTQDPTLGELAKILDFGIAKLMQADSQQTNCFMGTLAYASPEQMEGRELDSRSDIYSLGVMMFQMLTGKMPIRADTHSFGSWYKAHHSQTPKRLSQIDPRATIPKRLESLVMACLAKDADQRPQSIKAVLDELAPLEEKYGAGLRISHRINKTLSELPITKKSSSKNSAEATIFSLASWPKDKPIAEIVFYQPFRTSEQVWPTLWVMLPQRAIQSELIRAPYNNFICTMSPHPMVLWLTVVYTSTKGLRWLPCYLDLKSPSGPEMTGLLARTGRYKILFFALEEPRRCAHVAEASIVIPQCKLLKEWMTIAQPQRSVGNPQDSKAILKTELNDKLKPKIAKLLESIYPDVTSGIAKGLPGH